MILEAMLQRLYSSLQRGPCLNARPHNSRQRIDLTQLEKLNGTSINTVLPALLGETKKVVLPAKVPQFRKPAYPESEWSDEQKKHSRQFDDQTQVLKKLHEIANDAQEYFNDHGEIALYIGFPIISLPPNAGDNFLRSSRIIAPLALIPISLMVRKGANPGVSLAASGEDTDLLLPNPALLAWIEQQTGHEAPDLFEDDTGANPKREFEEIFSFVNKALGNQLEGFTFESELKPVSKTENLPDKAVLLSSAILGLFPTENPGLLRDTKWMINEESKLGGPIRNYLSNSVLEVSTEETNSITPLPDSNTWNQPSAFDSEFFIAPIDPSQALTASVASKSNALVIHGPPGTGKSQTITNIIGDHLAKGKRVLFVCDKRTALDVVLHRLRHNGLGHLCGIIHDPSRDRRYLYMGLRERLESLVENPPVPNPSAALNQLNLRLSGLSKELTGYYELLHRSTGESKDCFHELTGKWYNFSQQASDILPNGIAPLLTIETVEMHRVDIHEVMNRSTRARLRTNPFFENLLIEFDDFFKVGSTTIRENIAALKPLANTVDEYCAAGVTPLCSEAPLYEQATLRSNCFQALSAMLEQGDASFVTKIANLPLTSFPRWLKEWSKLVGYVKHIEQDLEREWLLLLSNRLPTLGEATECLVDLESYSETKGSLLRFLQVKKKGKANAILKKLGQRLSDESVDRVVTFYSGVRSRWLLADFCSQVCGQPVDAENDIMLRQTIATLSNYFDVVQSFAPNFTDPLLLQIHTGLADTESFREILYGLKISSSRALAINAFMLDISSKHIFKESYLSVIDKSLRVNKSANSQVSTWLEYIPTVEDIVRLEDKLTAFPVEIYEAIKRLALAETSSEQAITDLMQISYRNALSKLVEDNPSLLRIDSARINTSFDEYGRCMVEKRTLVKRHILHLWDRKQREALLVSSGTKVNSVGASLRNRLFIRGQKSLKLRQMIATGEKMEGADPLFDLCPIWMASPATVAQIFPRKELFDLIIFDEASQCRLEEALPVLLRGKRLVVAGDSKQLPPTRFFESNIADSGDTDAETVEELAEQRMSETEDLLSASLNLDVEESFLDVHYRSNNEALIDFSNHVFYNRRLQPIPGHPRNKALKTPIRLNQVNGTYTERTNPTEAIAVVELVKELLAEPTPPSIGVVSFNINQRDLIIEILEERAETDKVFADRLATARKLHGRDSFEGLFVRNLESVQGDERDHIIISTTFGVDSDGKFRRHFGALSRVGGDRRLNVLITRARQAIHVVTSIPTSEYRSEMAAEGVITGRHQLYAYLRYAEQIETNFESYQDYLEGLKNNAQAKCEILDSEQPSTLGIQLGHRLRDHKGISSTVHWGNEGFCVDLALIHPSLPEDVTLGILLDFNRFRKSPDPVAWEYFRTEILKAQGWQFERLWSPIFVREPQENIDRIARLHSACASENTSAKIL